MLGSRGLPVLPKTISWPQTLRSADTEKRKSVLASPQTKVTRVTGDRFERLVQEALTRIPRRFRSAIKNVAVVVESEPSPDLLEEMEIEPPDTLLGLYQGIPLTQRTWDFGNALPDRIVIFKGPIERDCKGQSEDEVVTAIVETVIHEFGHYFGLSEEEIEDIEERYWKQHNG